MVEHQGHPHLRGPVDRTNRAVLFWVEGHIPTTLAIRSVIDHDGRHRGLPWGIAGGSRSVEKVEGANVHLGYPDEAGQPEVAAPRPKSSRWIITLIDENEARRFVRTWHNIPFPLSSGSPKEDTQALVNVELLW